MDSKATVHIPFTIEEIEDVLQNLMQCHSEGYLNYGDPAFDAIEKLEKGLTTMKELNFLS